ncbi:MAG: hypothetical protein WAQ25_01780 [Candidatus Saccharimonas sp.]
MSTLARRPLDMSKLDTEATRKTLRKILIARSVPFIFIAIITILWLLLPYIATAQARNSLKTNNVTGAKNWLTLLATNAVFEQYKKPFNEAIVATHAKRFDSASQLFDQSIALAPEVQKCMVRTQLVLSSELAGDDAVQRNDRQAALAYYTRAAAQIEANPKCFSNQSELASRIAAKLAATLLDIKKDIKDLSKDKDTNKAEPKEPTEQQLNDMQNLQEKSEEWRQRSLRAPKNLPEYSERKKW